MKQLAETVVVASLMTVSNNVGNARSVSKASKKVTNQELKM